MKILYFTKYSRNGASSRLRSYQYFPFLEQNGFEVSVFPFFDEEYLNLLYNKQKIGKQKILFFYVNRFLQLFSIYKFDKIVIEKELFPYFFSWFEKLLWLFNVKYIVDYDDAIFHNYDLNSNKLILFFLKNKIDNVMKFSGCVVAGNNYLADRASFAGAKKIMIIPTVVNTEVYKPSQKTKDSKIIIGWIGSPSTFKYIKNHWFIFNKILKNPNVELHLIGVNDSFELEPNVHCFYWSEKTEVEMISNFDIGIMPLENSPWEQGKCAYKLIQYMGCGIPVVASAVGVNNRVVVEGVNGFLCTNDYEWIEKLRALIDNESLRMSFGKQGRLKAEQEYCIQKSHKTLITVLHG